MRTALLKIFFCCRVSHASEQTMLLQSSLAYVLGVELFLKSPACASVLPVLPAVFFGVVGVVPVLLLPVVGVLPLRQLIP